jgi:hypothetical protein
LVLAPLPLAYGERSNPAGFAFPPAGGGGKGGRSLPHPHQRDFVDRDVGFLEAYFDGVEFGGDVFPLVVDIF